MEEEQLLVSRSGGLGRIRLNRPKALNSLTLEMVRDFTAALREFSADQQILAVLVTGEGERGLCAGGDVRALYALRDGDKSHYKIFWREEYELNAQIAAFRKPYVVLMDGLVMGGGVGVSAHGNHRIVTERTRLAMPETAIGFVPDVGGTWLLTRGGGGGVYMALSGVSVGGADAIHLGLADRMIDSVHIPALIDGLCSISGQEDVDLVLGQVSRSPQQGELERHESLNTVMAGASVEDILLGLANCGTDFARAAMAEISRKSPTSLKVTHALLKRAVIADRLETCLISEYRAACRLLDGPDLYEGIRAAVVDKDKAPKWSPATLAEVDDATVADILEGTGDPEPNFHERE